MLEIYATKSAEISQREIDHMKISRELAGECVVLLENNGALPLKKTGKIALYGNGARKTVKGGTGSGDVNSRFVVNVEQGMEEAGFVITTKGWLERQETAMAQAKRDYVAWAEEEALKADKPPYTVMFDYPYVEPAPVLITEEDCKISDTDTAIYIVARNSGEGADRFCKEGDFLFYEEEKQNINTLCAHYENVIVVLNVGGVMNVAEIKEIPGISSIVLMSQLGNLGGNALADVLTGAVTPSGKTTDTWAKRYEDYPFAMQFSHNNGNVDEEYYKEGIYVGYRYFDTFGIKPEYCFGYGKSYTEFDIATETVVLDGTTVKVTAKVTNTGDTYAGKEVVQVYYSAPEGTLDKPYQELAGYKKSALLAPGESDTIEIAFDVKDMASYSMEEAAWLLEKGEYIIRVGSSSADTEIKATILLTETVKTEQCKNLMTLDCEMEELKADAADVSADGALQLTFDTSKIVTKQHIYQGVREEYKTSQTKVLTLQDVKDGICTVEELTAQLTVEEMADLCVGTLRTADQNIVGNASYLVPGAAGDTSSVIKESRGVKNMIFADGPAGIRLQPHFKTDKQGNVLPGGEMLGDDVNPFDPNLNEDEVDDYYQYCTAIPIGWALAMSWNTDLLEKAGDMVGKEMEQFNIDLWLAPAMNIHRNPLCGRNFEYYSEDPVIAGKTAAAITVGVQKHAGKGTTIKHFAVNNQEDNRYFTNAHVSERALREIYLKGFEITVKESQPLAIMTSYNLVNTVHTANSFELVQGIARDEWGFEGIVMTDWFTSQDVPDFTGKYVPKYPISASSGCIYSGNDLQMPGCIKNVADILEAVKNGSEVDGFKVSLADLQFTAANMIRVIAKMN